jgi:DNA-directed RNA polymerase alpha subunit
MDFSVRANNALKREGLFTLGEIVDLIMGEGLMRIRNLGKKTENEIKTRLLAFGYAQLSDAEKRRFFYDLLEKNAPSV